MAKWPALDVQSASVDLVSAMVDDYRPTAIEERPDAIRIFFAEPRVRDAAGAALTAGAYHVRPVDVDDEDWARRSQESLTPVTVGRITVAPPWCYEPPAPSPQPLVPSPQPLVIVITPSMGFGTGHHATTRLCLQALQAIDVTNRFVLDVGTGSGVLAFAAVRLGAARALGIDCDPDAIAAANDNIALNPDARGVDFRVADLSQAALPEADIVTANLTGALLVRSAGRLLDALRPGGVMILSGLMEEERDDVADAFGDGASRGAAPPIAWEAHEDNWVAMGLCCNGIR